MTIVSPELTPLSAERAAPGPSDRHTAWLSVQAPAAFAASDEPFNRNRE
jgi:hypothetical protein